MSTMTPGATLTPEERLARQGNTVYVGNLSTDITSEQLCTVFNACGPVIFVRLASQATHPNMQFNRSRFAFVEFAGPEHATLALGLDGIAIADRAIKVSRANSPLATATHLGPAFDPERHGHFITNAAALATDPTIKAKLVAMAQQLHSQFAAALREKSQAISEAVDAASTTGAGSSLSDAQAAILAHAQSQAAAAAAIAHPAAATAAAAAAAAAAPGALPAAAASLADPNAEDPLAKLLAEHAYSPDPSNTTSQRIEQFRWEAAPP